MSQNPVKRLAAAGALAAAILLLTMFASIPMPGGHGYVHLGDAGVFLAAYTLGGGWGALCAGAASALADILAGSGSAAYAPASFLIKGGVALLAGLGFTRRQSKGFRYLSYPVALLVPIGYFLYESAFFGAAAAVWNLPFNALQGLVGAGAAHGLIAALRRRGLGDVVQTRERSGNVRMPRDPKGGPDVVLLAWDEALALKTADILSVQGVTARVLIWDDAAGQDFRTLTPSGAAFLRHDGVTDAAAFAKQALEARKHDI